MTENGIVAAIDIGGTNIRCAVAGINEPGSFQSRTSISTPDLREPASIIDFISEQVDLCLEKASRNREALVAVGCAAPGITDSGSGVVISAANLRNWRNVPLARMLKDRFGVQAAAVENDVRAAAMGELQYGAGRGRRSLVYMTISTGVSAGIIIDGKPVRGHHHFAGEIAYLLPDRVHIGRDWSPNGCLELTAAGVGIAREWAAARGLSATDYSAADVFAAARSGDAAARQIVDRASDYLAQAAIALCSIVDPEILVIGGGIAENEPALVEKINRVVKDNLPFPPPVVRADLGGDSPLMGAMALAAAAANRVMETTNRGV